MVLKISGRTVPCPICEGRGWVKRGKAFGHIQCRGCHGSGRIQQIDTEVEEPGS